MKKLIFALALFCLSIAKGQEKVHRISLENDKNTAVESNFYIEKVYDGRQQKGSLGTVYVSLFDKKVSAGFEKPFTDEIQSLLNVLYPINQSKKAISIRIDQLYISESNSSSDSRAKEKASATIVIDIIEKKEDGKQYITGTFFATKEDTRRDVTKLHAELTSAIKNSFENYANGTQAYHTPIPFDPEEILNKDGLKN